MLFEYLFCICQKLLTFGDTISSVGFHVSCFHLSVSVCLYNNAAKIFGVEVCVCAEECAERLVFVNLESFNSQINKEKVILQL